MATSAEYQHLKECVTCSVCFNMFEGRDPRSLPCLHSCCSVCIKGVLDAARKVINMTTDICCPICQSPVAIPGGIVSNLPAYFLSRQLQTILYQMKTKHSKCIICKLTTQQAEVTSYCFQCTMAVCQKCKSKHDRRHKNHAQIRVSASTIAYMVCSEHDQHVEAFCMDCSRAVCSACAIDTHDDHTIKDLRFDEMNRTNALDKLFTNHIHSADNQLAKLTTIQDDFNKHIDAAANQLDRHHNDVIKQLKKQHKLFRAELLKRRDAVNQNLEKSKALIQQGKDCVDKLKRQSASWRRPIPAIPEASLTDTQELMEGIKQQIPSSNLLIEKPRRLVFEPNDHVSLGYITEDIKSTKISKQQHVSPEVSTKQGQQHGAKPKTKSSVTNKRTPPEVTGNLET